MNLDIEKAYVQRRLEDMRRIAMAYAMPQDDVIREVMMKTVLEIAEKFGIRNNVPDFRIEDFAVELMKQQGEAQEARIAQLEDALKPFSGLHPTGEIEITTTYSETVFSRVDDALANKSD